MRAKGDWGCRPFPLMQSPLPGPADRHQATAVDLNTGYNSLHRSYPRLSPSGSSFDWKRGDRPALNLCGYPNGDKEE